VATTTAASRSSSKWLCHLSVDINRNIELSEAFAINSKAQERRRRVLEMRTELSDEFGDMQNNFRDSGAAREGLVDPILH
jgi:hypothetical protein